MDKLQALLENTYKNRVVTILNFSSEFVLFKMDTVNAEYVVARYVDDSIWYAKYYPSMFDAEAYDRALKTYKEKISN